MICLNNTFLHNQYNIHKISWTDYEFINQIVTICSIEFCEVKVIHGAAGFAVVEGVETGVGFLEILGAVV